MNNCEDNKEEYTPFNILETLFNRLNTQNTLEGVDDYSEDRILDLEDGTNIVITQIRDYDHVALEYIFSCYRPNLQRTPENEVSFAKTYFSIDLADNLTNLFLPEIIIEMYGIVLDSLEIGNIDLNSIDDDEEIILTNILINWAKKIIEDKRYNSLPIHIALNGNNQEIYYSLN